MNLRPLFLLALLLVGAAAYAKTAIQYPRPMAGNPHIKLLTYNEHAIHYYKGFYGFGSSILFEQGEEFDLIAMGDPKGWQLNPIENRLFLKPLDAGANTNATIMTTVKSRGEKRVYHFKLQAAEAKNIDDEALSFEVRIIYPRIKGYGTSSSSGGTSGVVGPELSSTPSDVPPLNTPSLNWNYTAAGADTVRPKRVFDDGRFTYFQFPVGAPLPAIFEVDPDGYDAITNFRKSRDGYVIVENVGSLFSLRRGVDVVCIFNEQRPYQLKAVKKRSRGVLTKQQ